jgi:hypothetical protein
VKLSFDIDIDDVMAFHNYYYETNPAVDKQITRAWLGGSVMYIIIGLWLAGNDDSWNWTSVYSFGTIAILWFFFWPMLNKKRWLKRMRKEITKPVNSNWFGKVCTEFDDEKVYTIFNNGESTVQWSVFKKTVETPGYFFIFQSENQAKIIPKRGLLEAEIEQLKSLFAKHIAVNISQMQNKKIK